MNGEWLENEATFTVGTTNIIMCLWADDDRFLLPLTDSLLFVKRDRNEEEEGEEEYVVLKEKRGGKERVASCELSRLRVVFVEGFSFLESLIRVLLGVRETRHTNSIRPPVRLFRSPSFHSFH